MKRVKHWMVAVSSRIDHWLTDLEDHESAVRAALEDLIRRVARARAEHRSLERQAETQRCCAAEAMGEARRWRERAASEGDEARALECLRRARDADGRADAARRRAEEHEALCRSLEEMLGRLRETQTELTDRYRALKARDACSAARRQMSGAGPERVEEALGRWEAVVEAGDLEVDPLCGLDVPTRDSFARAYEADEEAVSLRDELARLREGR